MQIDQYGIPFYLEEEALELLYSNKNLDIGELILKDPERFNRSVEETYSDYQNIKKYECPSLPVNVFHSEKASNWFMPDEYKNFDIESYLLNMCENDAELIRMEEELNLFKQMNSLHLLKFTKYFVDTLTKNNRVWGVGRGSSTASFALYKIGLHSIDPIRWDIPITEFFKHN